MSARRVTQPARLLWLAPALLGLMASPGTARAGCGDHARSSASAVDIGLASLAKLDGQGDAPIPPKPCNGPSCSGRRHDAPTATPPAPSIAPERDLVATRVEPVPSSEARSAVAGRLPTYEPPSLTLPDRPPRP
jgi:hypothetical protein